MPSISKLKPFEKIEIIRKCSGLSILQKLLLLTIATHLGKNDYVFLSITTLQKECCVTTRTPITQNIQALIDADIIWKVAPSGKYKSNRYGINFDVLVFLKHQCGLLERLPQSFRKTRVVFRKDPKRKIKEIQKKTKGETSEIIDKKAEALEARKAYRKLLKLTPQGEIQ